MAVRRPPGGSAVDFHIAPVARTANEFNAGLLKIRPSLEVPTPWRMDNHFLPIQGVQYRWTPALIKPQAPHQLF
jgi:hypothetical protein